jgi:hypothetical protein
MRIRGFLVGDGVVVKMRKEKLPNLFEISRLENVEKVN